MRLRLRLGKERAHESACTAVGSLLTNEKGRTGRLDRAEQKQERAAARAHSDASELKGNYSSHVLMPAAATFSRSARRP